jgi:hypothetical protein
VTGSETDRWLAFRTAFRELESRIKVFTSLPLHSIERSQLQQRLNEIGRVKVAESPGEAAAAQLVR